MNLELGKESINKLLLKYSIPAIVGMIVVSMYNAIDRIFIGHIENVGAIALSGVGITLPIVTILLSFELLIGIGVSTNISASLGKGNKKHAEKYLGQLIIVAIFIGLSLVLGISIFKNNILIMFGASESSMYYAKEYIDVILIGTVFYIIGFSLITTIRSEGNPKKASKLLIISCIINIVLDPIFIFYWGIKGAAIATVLSQIFVFVMAIHYYTKGKSNLKLRRENLIPDIIFIKRIIINGLPIFFMQIFTSLIQVIFNNSVKIYGGDLAIGALATIVSISNIFLMPVIGINQGSLPIIGFNYGAKQYDRAKKALIYGTIVGFIILSLGFILVLLLPDKLISLFNKDKELMDISVQGIRIYLFMMPISVIAITAPNYFQSIGKVNTSIFLSLLRQAILLIPLLIILSKYFGIIGVWLAQPVADLLSSIISGVFLIKEFKNYNAMVEAIE
ncbi:MATE family efflux transporter [Romboutsia ilealis]|uniref:MATE family efflux transporter n=1 Tax=Romboutsia ilealis TaxID=1115758 RepID=UPI002ED06D7B